MSDVLRFYQEQAETAPSATPWHSALQQKARADLARLAFPTRRTEDWKYTPVDALLEKRFHTGSANSTKEAEAPHWGTPSAYHVKITNGQVLGLESLAEALPAGVVIQPLADALTTHRDLIQPHLGNILPHEHGFQALNTAMWQTGLFIYVPPSVVLDKPISVSHTQTRDDLSVTCRHLIVLEQESQATVIEDYSGDDTRCYLTNAMTEIKAQPRSKLTHYRLQRESRSAYHIGHVAVQQQEASYVACHLVSLGGQLVRSDNTIRLQGAGAGCLQNGIYAPRDGQHMDHHTAVYHEVPDCYSDEDYKGILAGKARAVFNGKVVVKPGAVRTVAKQQNRNLLLTAQAEVDTKPQLEIFADDVVCSHGATVGQLDEEALFYLATRGIARNEASRYLIKAFAAENLRLLGLDGMEQLLWWHHE